MIHYMALYFFFSSPLVLSLRQTIYHYYIWLTNDVTKKSRRRNVLAANSTQRWNSLPYTIKISHMETRLLVYERNNVKSPVDTPQQMRLYSLIGNATKDEKQAMN